MPLYHAFISCLYIMRLYHSFQSSFLCIMPFNLHFFVSCLSIFILCIMPLYHVCNLHVCSLYASILQFSFILFIFEFIFITITNRQSEVAFLDEDLHIHSTKLTYLIPMKLKAAVSLLD